MQWTGHKPTSFRQAGVKKYGKHTFYVLYVQKTVSNSNLNIQFQKMPVIVSWRETISPWTGSMLTVTSYLLLNSLSPWIPSKGTIFRVDSTCGEGIAAFKILFSQPCISFYCKISRFWVLTKGWANAKKWERKIYFFYLCNFRVRRGYCKSDASS